MEANITQKIFKNATISFGAKFLSVFLGIASVGVLTRSLGREGFGEYSIIFAYLYVFSLFADFGLYSLLLREISRPKADESKTFTHIFVIRACFLAVFFSASFFVINLFPYSENVKNNIFWGVLVYVFISFNQLIVGVFQKHLKMLTVALSEVVARAVQLGAFLWIFYSGIFSLEKFLYFVVAASCINFVLLIFTRRKYVKFKFSLDWRYVGWLLKEAWPLGVSVVFVYIYFKMDSIILSLMKSAEDVGIYSIAYKIFENLIVFPAMFMGLIIPLLSNYYIADRQKFRNTVQKTQDVLFYAVIPLVFGGIMLAAPMLSLIAGSGFSEAVLPFDILMVSLVFVFVASLYGSVVIVINKQKVATFAYATGAVFNFLTNLYFIKKYSYYGAALTTLGTEVLVTSLLFIIITKKIKFRPVFRGYGKVVLAGAIMAVVLAVFPVKNIIVRLLTGASVYGLLVYYFGVITVEEVELIAKDLFRKTRDARPLAGVTPENNRNSNTP